MAATTARTALPRWLPVAVLVAAGAVLGVVTLRLVGDARWFALGDGSGTTAAVAVAAGWALIGVGLWSWSERPRNAIGPLATAAGFASLVPGLMGWGGGPAVVFTSALLLSALAVPLGLHTALAYPSGRLGSHVERVAIGLAYLEAALMWPAGALFTDPVDDGCFLCSHNLVGVLRDRATVEELAGWSAWLGLAYCAVIALLMVRRVLVSPPARRAVIAPILAGGIALCVVHGIACLGVVRSGFQSFGPEDNALFLVRCAALALVAAGVAWGFVRGRRTRAAVAEVVARLGDAPAPGALRDELARLLRDPTITLVYWLPERAEYVDADGRPTTLPRPGDGRAVTEVRRGGERIAALVHDASVHQEQGLADSLAATLRLAVEHERLRASVEAQLAELRASRARIVAVGDAERRRLERDLHDGAQQALLSLGLALQLAHAPPGPGPEADELVAEARQELDAALADLRELAHGIHPAVLTEEGLAAALATLAERSPVPLIVGRLPAERLPEPIEVTSYLLTAEAVASAAEHSGSTVSVTIARDGSCTVVAVEGGASAGRPELEALADRVAALGGRLEVTASTDGRMHMRAELPGAGATA